MFNVKLLFLKNFHKKNREILHKAVLTPQKYEDYFFGKKNGGKNKNYILEELRQLCSKFHNFSMKICGETRVQS